MINCQPLMGGGKITFSHSWLKGLFAFALLLCVTSCYKDDIANLQSQIDQLKGGEIATISSQIKAIDASINDLKKVDETIEGLIAELQKDGENYATQIAELIKMDSKLDEKIAELQQYTDGELAKQKDWVNATFATLEQLESLSETVAGLGVKIGEITESLESAKKEITENYEKAISEAISSLEESMKQWVNEQLADYYTIAQTDAALKALEEKYDKVDEDLKKELEAQKTALEDSKKEITEAYKKAIEEAITAHDGKINEKIAKDIAAAKKELQDQIDTINSEIDSIKSRLDAIETEIATIDSQIEAIDVSISDLKKVDETIEGLIAELQKDGENYAAQIAELIKMDSKLDEKIAELQQYTDGELAKQKDWVNATFATLEQLESLSETVAGLGVKIGEITESLESAKKEITENYEKAISEAISSLEKSMKQWVNEQLADYYTIAQTDAALKALEEKYDKVDEDLKKELEEQKTALEDSKKEITEAYKKAIEEAITAHDGKINEKIAKDIAAAKKELQDQIDTINTEIASIKSRLVKIETDIESLINRIQSIVVIPQDADGSVTVDASGTSTICFDIKPVAIADSIAKVWNALEEKDRGSMISVKLKNLSGQGEKVSAAAIKSISIVDNEFKVGVKFTDLTQRSLASLQIMFGQSDVASEYFTLWPSSVPKNYVAPTGIAILNVNPIHLTTGTQASIEFRVNPSNATFTFSGENSQIELDMVGTVQTKSSYVTTPSNYKLVKVEYVFEAGIGENGENGDLKVGQYRAIIEDTKRSAEYDEMAALVLNVKDANGDDVQISSSAFEVVGHNFNNLPKTGLPIVVINTPNAEPINSKDVWKDGTTMTIINSDMTFDYQGTLGIKGRGNTTWGYPKKPYALKLDSKSKILGMPKHKRWCLLANWMDRTMIRNAVAFEIARKCPGLDWTPRGEFVEVVLNGTHIGNYYLCEQIKVDKNRVDIAELDDKVTEGDGITGGFIMELDTYYDEVNKFKSARRNLPWMFKDPDEVNSTQFTYMQNYVNAMEDALYDDSKFAAREFTNYMDLESFVDWWFVYELAMNWEPNHPKSSYMHKDKNGVIKAGPVWDFDYATFAPGSSSSYRVNNAIYYGRLFEDAGFKSLVKTKWQEQKSKYEEIGQFIDALGAKLSESDELNHIMWPISSTVNGDESMNYDDAVSRMKTAYLAKLSWMDTQISSW